MMKPSLPKGTRDFNPAEMVRRNYILETITTVFKRYGFQQIETPAMENITTLTGKYGEEGDQLLYKILNSRIHETKDKVKLREEFEKALDRNSNSEVLTERALRYDLTVPFARYVVMHQQEITFPFKRYQVQPVWRADRPQKGRYREFLQCDADVIGSPSLLNEAELVQVIRDVFSRLGIGVIIKINNRKILAGLAEKAGQPGKLAEFATVLDKCDKIGMEKVKEELEANGFAADELAWMESMTECRDDVSGNLAKLETLLQSSETGKKGLEEIRELFRLLAAFDPGHGNLELDLTLARGLSYYTGAILEVKVKDHRSSFTSSMLGGGRYDDLTGIFGLPGVSGVGISFGIDRIYDVMEEMNMFDGLRLNSSATQLLFVNFGPAEAQYCLNLAGKVREAGINAEVYPEPARLKKQLSYADAKKIPWVVMAGAEEINSGNVSLKNMITGTQSSCKSGDLISLIS